MFAVLGWILFGVILLAALPVQVLGLPGTWLILANAAAAWLLTGGEPIGPPSVVVLALMAVTGEVGEFYASAAGAGKGEPVRWTLAAALIGAFAGGLVGAPFFFGLGAIPGMALGAFSAVLILNLASGRDLAVSLSQAAGAFMGRLAGTVIKLAVAAAMVAVVIVALIR
jgi:uncharacterized protein YqgC (DUF456 family)